MSEILHQNKKYRAGLVAYTVRRGSKNKRETRPEKTVSILPRSIKKGILISRCGEFRCVGATITCAGVWGLQPPYAAVFFYFLYYSMRTNVCKPFSAINFVNNLWLFRRKEQAFRRSIGKRYIPRPEDGSIPF